MFQFLSRPAARRTGYVASLAIMFALLASACSEDALTAAEAPDLAAQSVALHATDVNLFDASAKRYEDTVRLWADLTGDAEVGGGDPDGSGTMRIVMSAEAETVCYQLRSSDIERATRSHIHVGEAGVNGGVVVFLFDEVIDPPIAAPESGRGCNGASAEAINNVAANPAGYYINVHNDDWPGGAIRGQLTAR